MRPLRVSFRLRSSLGTPFQADTIFGHICWAIRHLEGEGELKSFLDAYDNHPPLLLSDGFPFVDVCPDTRVHYLPRPLIPVPGDSAGSMADSLGIPANDLLTRRQCAAAWKALEKKKWIAADVLFQRNSSLDMAAIFADCFHLRICPISMAERSPGQCPCTRWLDCPGLDTGARAISTCRAVYPRSETVLTTHNVLNRWTSASMNLYQEEDTFPACGFYFLALLDESVLSLDRLRSCLDYIQHSGYGRDASTGKGALSEIKIEDWFLPECPGATHYMNLSSAFVPVAGDVDPQRSFYSVHVKHGKLGNEYAVSGNVWKKPILMLSAGSVFAGDPNAVHGRLVRDVHAEYPHVVQYGYAFPMGVTLDAQT